MPSNLGFPSPALAEPLRLLDGKGRQLRGGKRGVIPVDLAPVLDGVHVVGKACVDPVQHFGRWYHRAVVRATTLADADHRRLHGMAHSRQEFR